MTITTSWRLWADQLVQARLALAAAFDHYAELLEGGERLAELEAEVERLRAALAGALEGGVA